MTHQNGEHFHKNKVHHILAHSYAVYFVLFLAAVFLDTIFHFSIFPDSVLMPLGFFFLVLASIMIVWAQKTGRDLRKVAEVKTEHFGRGPYHYTRIPTQWGLFFLLLGFGVIANAFFVVLSTIISLFIFRFVFMKKHDQYLVDRYGDAYKEYKKSVRF